MISNSLVCFGSQPLERFLIINFQFFKSLRASGGTWEQIANLLSSEGLRSRKGKAISPDVLRAAYSRALRKLQPDASQHQNSARSKHDDVGNAGTGPPEDFAVTTGSDADLLTERLARAMRLRNSTLKGI